MLPPPPGAALAGCDEEGFDEWLDASLELALARGEAADEFDEQMERLRSGSSGERER